MLMNQPFPFSIAVSRYTLEASAPLNARSQKLEREGALLKVHFEDGLVGYADCHPWTELGDLPLTKQCLLLSCHQMTPLTRCSLYLARVDAEARSKQISLVQDHAVPLSHFLVTNFLNFSQKDVEEILKQGFTCIKIKLGKQLNEEITHLIKLFSSSSLKLRFDFNESLSEKTFENFLMSIEVLREKIDFIEDPFPFDPINWEKIQVHDQISLACDRQAIKALKMPQAANVLILKPAIQPIELFSNLSNQITIVTSYLAHPLDQITAAYFSTKIDPTRQNIHGLNAHHVYQKNRFSQLLATQGPHFLSPKGTGWGYDHLLQELVWQPLI